MEDFAFKIQLGLILPKIKEKIGAGLSEVTDELVAVVQAGLGDDEKVDIALVKEMIMKDLEIFIDRNVLPPIDARLNPPEPEAPAEEAASDESEAAEEAPE